MIRTSKEDAGERIAEGYNLVSDQILCIKTGHDWSIVCFSELPGIFFIARLLISSTKLFQKVLLTEEQSEIVQAFILEYERVKAEYVESDDDEDDEDDGASDKDELPVTTASPKPSPATPRKKPSVQFHKPLRERVKEEEHPNLEEPPSLPEREPLVCSRRFLSSGSRCDRGRPIAVCIYLKLEGTGEICVDLVCRLCYNYLVSRQSVHVLGAYFIRSDERVGNRDDLRVWSTSYSREIISNLSEHLPSILDQMNMAAHIRGFSLKFPSLQALLTSVESSLSAFAVSE